jgi:hypothetical protein
VSGQQLAFLFIILDVFIRYTGSFGGLNLEIDTLVIDYLMIVFFVIGMSGIKLRPVLLSLLAAFVLAWLIRTIQTPYMLPQVAGFQIDLTYHSMNDFLNMCVMLFCGRLLRRRIGMDRALLTSAWLPVAFLLLSFTLFSSVGFSYQLVDDVTDMALNASFGLGSPTGQVALMFVLAAAGGRRAAWTAAVIWACIHLALPILLWGARTGWSFAYVVGLLMEPLQRETWNLYWSVPFPLIGLTVQFDPGWVFGPLDVLFVLFGYLVHRRLKRRPEAVAQDEIAVVRSQAKDAVDLPILRFDYRVKAWS